MKRNVIINLIQAMHPKITSFDRLKLNDIYERKKPSQRSRLNSESTINAITYVMKTKLRTD